MKLSRAGTQDPRAGFADLARKIYQDTGIVLQENKVEMVVSRLRKRMKECSVQSLGEYSDVLNCENASSEVELAICALTTNVSSFFREKHHFDYLEQEFIKWQKRGEGGEFLIWSAGCSNGQEAYSMAIRVLDILDGADNVRILATDIDRNVISHAKKGEYNRLQVDSLAADTLSKYFEKAQFEPGQVSFRIKDNVRKLVHFRVLNLFEEWPMKKKFNAIFCRNVVIYFDEAAQKKLWLKFLNSITECGFISVGHSERIDCKDFISCGPTTYRKKILVND